MTISEHFKYHNEHANIILQREDVKKNRMLGIDKYLRSEKRKNRLSNEMSGIYLNESDYPDYNPHLTLAYVQKDRFQHVKEGLSLKVPIRTLCYSPIQGGKSYFNLDEGNIHHDIDAQIARLEQEWDRLDSMGGNTGDRQREIEQELIRLRTEKQNQPLDPNDPKSKELWDKLRQSIQ